MHLNCRPPVYNRCRTYLDQAEVSYGALGNCRCRSDTNARSSHDSNRAANWRLVAVDSKNRTWPARSRRSSDTAHRSGSVWKSPGYNRLVVPAPPKLCPNCCAANVWLIMNEEINRINLMLQHNVRILISLPSLLVHSNYAPISATNWRMCVSSTRPLNCVHTSRTIPSKP